MLANLSEAKRILETENDEDLRDMAKMEIDETEPKIVKMEEEIRTKLEKLHEKKRGERLSESGSSKFTDEKLKKDKEQ